MYDGKSFTQFTVKEGLSNDNIYSIIEDKNKNIWIATYSNGVMKLKINSFTYFIQLEEIGKGKVNTIIEDKKGNIWFGYMGRV